MTNASEAAGTAEQSPAREVQAGAVLPSEGRGRNRVPWVVASIASVVALIAVGALVVQIVGGGAASSESGAGLSLDEQGFATPEESASFFAEAFADGRLDDASTAFATTRLVDGFSFTDAADRAGAVFVHGSLPAAKEYRTVNLERRVGEVGEALSNLTQSALIPEFYDDPTYVFDDAAGMTSEQFAAAVAPSALASVSVERVDVIESPSDNDYAANQKAQVAPWGAQDSRTVAVLFGTAQGPAALGLTMVEYDGRWYVSYLGASTLGTNVNAVVPVTESEYQSMVEHAQSIANRQ